MCLSCQLGTDFLLQKYPNASNVRYLCAARSTALAEKAQAWTATWYVLPPVVYRSNHKFGGMSLQLTVWTQHTGATLCVVIEWEMIGKHHDFLLLRKYSVDPLYTYICMEILPPDIQYFEIWIRTPPCLSQDQKPKFDTAAAGILT